MKTTLNSYIAILLITIAGAGATFVIVHVATTDTLAATINGNEANYASLERNILK